MSASEYEEAEDGVWIRPVARGHRHACCDCDLVHVVDYRITEDGAVEFRARRDNRATAAMRRKKKRGAK